MEVFVPPLLYYLHEKAAHNHQYVLYVSDGEVVDPSMEGIGMPQSENNVSNSQSDDSEEHSSAFSELTQMETGDVDVQSPRTNVKGILEL